MEKRITIPRSIESELLRRLEDQGSDQQSSKFYDLYHKLFTSQSFMATEAERDELRYHCQIMIAIADDFSGLDKQLNAEADGARKLLKQIALETA